LQIVELEGTSHGIVAQTGVKAAQHGSFGLWQYGITD